MISSTILYVELNCFAIAILVVIALNMCREDIHYSVDQQLFYMLLAACISLLVLEMLMRTLDGKPGESIKLVYIAAIVLYNILNPVICMIWYYYVDYYVNDQKRRITKAPFPIILPVLINAGLSIVSMFINIYFTFGGHNVYYRGRFIFVLLGICLYIITYTSIFLIYNRNKINRKDFYYLLFFAIPPTVGGVLQYMFRGVNIIWIAATLSICIIFINIQKEQMNTDYLTGVNNRRNLSSFLQVIAKNERYKLIAGIMIDIDDFKIINDQYGHDQGDQALKDTAQLLRKTFRRTDFVARYGGDEFIVIMKIDEPSELGAMVQRLEENVMQFNAHKLAPYKISLSMGYDCYEKEAGSSLNEFLRKIDHLMYLNKQRIRTNCNGSHA